MALRNPQWLISEDLTRHQAGCTAQHQCWPAARPLTGSARLCLVETVRSLQAALAIFTPELFCRVWLLWCISIGRTTGTGSTQRDAAATKPPLASPIRPPTHTASPIDFQLWPGSETICTPTGFPAESPMGTAVAGNSSAFLSSTKCRYSYARCSPLSR